MYDPSRGSNLRSYIIRSVRNAIHAEANKHHPVFDLPQKAKPDNVHVTPHVDLAGVDDDIHLLSFLSSLSLTPMESTVLNRRVLGCDDCCDVATDLGCSQGYVYRIERRLKEKIEECVLNG